MILVGLSIFHETAQTPVQEYPESHWVTDGCRMQPPVVKRGRFKFMDTWHYMNENLTQGACPRTVTERT